MAFGPLCTQFLDADKPRAIDAEVDWYASRLPDDAGPVLDAMCGSGRLLLPLLDEGFHMHGVDSSAAMIASCDARLADAGYEATLVRQDIAALNLAFRYTGALIAGASFQLIVDPADARSALERLRAHLVPPGILLLDLLVPRHAANPPGAPLVEARTVTLADGTRIAHRSETFVDAQARRIDTKSRYERRMGPAILAREDEMVAFTWYTEDEIVALLTETGYRDIAIEPPAFASDDDAHRFAVLAHG
jgi:trans-aconitate methyltransferase